jgi:hypothetical protein
VRHGGSREEDGVGRLLDAKPSESCRRGCGFGSRAWLASSARGTRSGLRIRHRVEELIQPLSSSRLSSSDSNPAKSHASDARRDPAKDGRWVNADEVLKQVRDVGQEHVSSEGVGRWGVLNSLGG